MKKPTVRVRRNSAAKAASTQAPNTADTFVVTITEEIRQSANAAGETVGKFMEAAIRHKLENNKLPLQHLLNFNTHDRKYLFADRDGRLFRWNEDPETKLEELTLAVALEYWRYLGVATPYFRDYAYPDGSVAYSFMKTLKHHWEQVAKAKA
ncbi:MAG TPA: hypothetical protein VFZ59_08090 [Verrucomicrobiae bacterium]|nr:hypothetical protein [Verrucomicrobiae bacterium]